MSEKCLKEIWEQMKECKMHLSKAEYEIVFADEELDDEEEKAEVTICLKVIRKQKDKITKEMDDFKKKYHNSTRDWWMK